MSTGNGRVWTGEGALEPWGRPVDPALGPEDARASHRRPEMEAWVMSRGRRPRARLTTNGVRQTAEQRRCVSGKDLWTLTRQLHFCLGEEVGEKNFTSTENPGIPSGGRMTLIGKVL